MSTLSSTISLSDLVAIFAPAIGILAVLVPLFTYLDSRSSTRSMQDTIAAEARMNAARIEAEARWAAAQKRSDDLLAAMKQDAKDFNEKWIAETKSFNEKWMAETKEFHGRICSIEERTRSNIMKPN